MKSKRRSALVIAVFATVGLPFAGAYAGPAASAPLMPTKDPAVHQGLMQAIGPGGEFSLAKRGTVLMVPLMPTKDRMAHEASSMQAYTRFEPTGLSRSGAAGVEAPLMPTKDPVAHQG